MNKTHRETKILVKTKHNKESSHDLKDKEIGLRNNNGSHLLVVALLVSPLIYDCRHLVSV